MPGASLGALAVDDAELYFVKGTLDSTQASVIAKLPVAGGEPVILASDVNPLALVLDSTHLYWSEFGRQSVVGGLVRKVAKSGGPVLTLASRQAQPGAPVLVGSNVVWGQSFFELKLTTTPKEPCVDGMCSD